jgi:hypothetical protein
MDRRGEGHAELYAIGANDPQRTEPVCPGRDNALAFPSHQENTMKTNALIAAALLGLSLGVAGCDKKEGPSEAAKDALDMRSHEKLKDAGEDLSDEARDAKNKIKKEAEDATD